MCAQFNGVNDCPGNIGLFIGLDPKYTPDSWVTWIPAITRHGHKWRAFYGGARNELGIEFVQGKEEKKWREKRSS
jgi:hypothetical protein